MSKFVVGHLYSNDEISSSLSVGNAGGIRPCLRKDGTVRRLVLLTSLSDAKVATENPYHDRIEGEILIYTGRGLKGNQEPGGLNKRLVEQLTVRFPVWCFQQLHSRRNKSAGTNRWQFLGLLSLVRFHKEDQVDIEGKLRSVWLFEFDTSQLVAEVEVDKDTAISKQLSDKVSMRLGNDSSETLVESVRKSAASELAIESVRSWLLTQHPRDFELILRKVFEVTGFNDVAVTRYSQDGGIDLLASFGKSGWPVRPWQIQIQAKRWLHTVGRRDVAELRGSLKANGLGCLIATSFFSKAAVLEACESGKAPVTLINGRQIASLIISTGLSPSVHR